MRLIGEIITTERYYVKNLEIIVNEYVVPCQEFLSEGEVSSLFSTLPQIHRFSSTELLPRLEEAHKNLCFYNAIGNVFREMSPLFKLYSAYVANFEAAMEAHTALSASKRRKKYRDLLKTNEARFGHPLTSLLISPVQRIPRYKLLLRELVELTPNCNVDYKNSVDALSRVSLIASRIDMYKQAHEMKARMKVLSEKFEGYQGGVERLLQPNRSLIVEGPLSPWPFARDTGEIIDSPDAYVGFSDHPKAAFENRPDLEALIQQDGPYYRLPATMPFFLYGFLFNDELLFCDVLRSDRRSKEPYRYVVKARIPIGDIFILPLPVKPEGVEPRLFPSVALYVRTRTFVGAGGCADGDEASRFPPTIHPSSSVLFLYSIAQCTREWPQHIGTALEGSESSITSMRTSVRPTRFSLIGDKTGQSAHPRQFFGNARCDGRVVVFGGKTDEQRDGVVSGDMFSIDAAKKTVTIVPFQDARKADPPAPASGPHFPEARYNPGMCCFQNKIYVAGGFHLSTRRRFSFFCADPTTGAWRRIRPRSKECPREVRYCTLTPVPAGPQGSPYERKPGILFISSEVSPPTWFFCPEDEAWTPLPIGFPKLTLQSAIALNGGVFVYGGVIGQDMSTWCYFVEPHQGNFFGTPAPSTSIFGTLAVLRNPRSASFAAGADVSAHNSDKVIVYGGISCLTGSPDTNYVRLFTPTTSTWVTAKHSNFFTSGGCVYQIDGSSFSPASSHGDISAPPRVRSLTSSRDFHFLIIGGSRRLQSAKQKANLKVQSLLEPTLLTLRLKKNLIEMSSSPSITSPSLPPPKTSNQIRHLMASAETFWESFEKNAKTGRPFVTDSQPLGAKAALHAPPPPAPPASPARSGTPPSTGKLQGTPGAATAAAPNVNDGLETRYPLVVAPAPAAPPRRLRSASESAGSPPEDVMPLRDLVVWAHQPPAPFSRTRYCPVLLKTRARTLHVLVPRRIPLASLLAQLRINFVVKRSAHLSVARSTPLGTEAPLLSDSALAAFLQPRAHAAHAAATPILHVQIQDGPP
eukprot:gnl/Chilomastix_cuspidata/3990.p1 GENE.gnl/Chilomastix_cuspidata/3990~~gnl/Chilomastix_cuspidata/3990.p1  ORF type:complete len:1109 (+),score=392.75 gnl/Chilomastix_cuspidata/3990:229-3327(+)